MKSIFKGEKKFLKMNEVRFVNIKKFNELSLKQNYSKWLTRDDVKLYFPDSLPKNRTICREYFWNVISTFEIFF